MGRRIIAVSCEFEIEGHTIGQMIAEVLGIYITVSSAIKPHANIFHISLLILQLLVLFFLYFAIRYFLFRKRNSEVFKLLF